VDHGLPFAQIVETQIEESRSLPIDDSNTQRRLRSKQRRQRLQLKPLFEINVRRTKLRREFVLLPKVLSGARKDGLTSGITAQVRSQIENAAKISVERSVFADSSRTP
jgi:hypothetical protein